MTNHADTVTLMSLMYGCLIFAHIIAAVFHREGLIILIQVLMTAWVAAMLAFVDVGSWKMLLDIALYAVGFWAFVMASWSIENERARIIARQEFMQWRGLKNV